ncbi:hypothetical protein BVC80_5419g1 [Macleaya cordata]|uniref:Uncharacterized protein n=1 Tax=Macleaya cordata TaxID=56857 RepID=A0A200Q9F3_MACCD|nr:hypothetical protein BVC80_5419g1 [Macleaya cordata]
MDESWRMRMGSSNLPRRRSTEESSSDRMMRRNVFGLNCNNSDSESTTLLDPENFNDVFGGPPRSIVSRQFSGDLITAGNKSNNNTTFYEEIFRSSEFVAQAKNNNNGRKLPGFRIPPRIGGGGGGSGDGGGFRRSDGFYDDIFGSDNEDRRSWRSELKSNKLNYSKSSKSNSSSVLSSEDLSPLRPSIAEDFGI